MVKPSNPGGYLFSISGYVSNILERRNRNGAHSLVNIEISLLPVISCSFLSNLRIIEIGRGSHCIHFTIISKLS